MSIENKIFNILKNLKKEIEWVDIPYYKFSEAKSFKPILLKQNESWMVNLEWYSNIVDENESNCLQYIEDDEKNAKSFQEECQLKNIIFTWDSKKMSTFYHNWSHKHYYFKEYTYHLSIPLQMYMDLMDKIIKEETKSNHGPQLKKTNPSF